MGLAKLLVQRPLASLRYALPRPPLFLDYAANPREAVFNGQMTLQAAEALARGI
jgi:hypothetical protein